MTSYMRNRGIAILVEEMKKNKIICDTSIQRKEDQWDRKKKSLLILSVIEGIIIPGIFVSESKLEGKTKNNTLWEVLDGKQRLTTLKSFLEDGFKLDKSLDAEYANKRFSELDEETQSLIKAAEIPIYVYQDLSEEDTERIFCRLNNGQKLSNDNLIRAHMGSELRTFVDTAINKPFIMEKTAMTKGQIKKSEDQGVILGALVLVVNGPIDFKKDSLMAFTDDFRSNYDEAATQKVLSALDWLDSIFEERNKYLKKISLPMIIAVAATCEDDKKEQFKNNLKNFLNDYTTKEDYLQYCGKGTSSLANVTGRYNYFKNMAN